MTKYKLEYIWLDGKQPIPELRAKTRLNWKIYPSGVLTAAPPCRPKAASRTVF